MRACNGGASAAVLARYTSILAMFARPAKQQKNPREQTDFAAKVATTWRTPIDTLAKQNLGQPDARSNNEFSMHS